MPVRVNAEERRPAEGGGRGEVSLAFVVGPQKWSKLTRGVESVAVDEEKRRVARGIFRGAGIGIGILQPRADG